MAGAALRNLARLLDRSWRVLVVEHSSSAGGGPWRASHCTRFSFMSGHGYTGHSSLCTQCALAGTLALRTCIELVSLCCSAAFLIQAANAVGRSWLLCCLLKLSLGQEARQSSCGRAHWRPVCTAIPLPAGYSMLAYSSSAAPSSLSEAGSNTAISNKT